MGGKLRRVRWPLGMLLMLGVAVGPAVARSHASLVEVYNETGGRIAESTVSACGQSQLFHDVGDRESVRLKLAAAGGAGEISVATSGLLIWRGNSIEPRGGYRATVRRGRGGQVESSTTVSWWQPLLRNQPTSTPRIPCRHFK